MVGVQLPLLLALLEYGCLLAAAKYAKTNSMANTWPATGSNVKVPSEEDRKELFKKVDKICAGISLAYIIVFNIIYWAVMSQ